MDALHQLEMQILYLLALLVGSCVVWALTKLLSLVGVRLKADRQALLESAVNKVLTFAVTRADETIREKGWDHIDTKNEVVSDGLQLLQSKFQETANAAGFDLTNADDRLRLMHMMERMWPDVAARVSASPASPPAPVTPAVVAVPPAP